MATDPSAADPDTPSEGLVTWHAEGTEGGPFHSRKLHVPSDWSGLTIGRGYDMKNRTAAEIQGHLVDCEVPQADAVKLSGAAGLFGATARSFIVSNGLSSFEISPRSQRLLFDLCYAALKADVKRISSGAATVAAYGAIDWDKLHPAIAEVLVDLRFRGDYTPDSRKLVQKLAAANDLAGFAAAMKQRSNWANVPQDRFNRRNDHLAAALKPR